MKLLLICHWINSFVSLILYLLIHLVDTETLEEKAKHPQVIEIVKFLIDLLLKVTNQHNI